MTAAASTERAHCALCGADDTTAATYRPGPLPVVTCARCGLRYTSPRLDGPSRDALYDGDYFRSPDAVTRGYEDYLGEAATTARTFAARLARLARLRGDRAAVPGPVRLLDVGAATGEAVAAAAARGWVATGVELSAWAVAEARERGRDVRLGTLDDRDAPAGSFDVVLSWDVVEHLADPVAHLRRLVALCRPGGLVNVITPDRSGPGARLFGPRWVEMRKPAEHLWFFSRAEVTRLLAGMGAPTVASGYAGKHVSADFALRRLAAAWPPLGALSSAAARVGLGGAVLKVNPLDKMDVVARVGR